jgi:hypothetical protein
MKKYKGNVSNTEERFNTIVPSKDIICKDCIFKNGGTEMSDDYTKSYCQIYKHPNAKPSRILFEKGLCEYYHKEEQDDE